MKLYARENPAIAAARRQVSRGLDNADWVPLGRLAARKPDSELAREVAPNSVLSGTRWSAIARSLGQDDYLFAGEDGRLASIHLAWTGREEPALSAAFFDDMADFTGWLVEEAAHVAMIEAQALAEDETPEGSVLCRTCGADWGRGRATEGCRECGGFPLFRTCPACNGRCMALFRRASADSNDSGEAHWIGRCERIG